MKKGAAAILISMGKIEKAHFLQWAFCRFFPDFGYAGMDLSLPDSAYVVD